MSLLESLSKLGELQVTPKGKKLCEDITGQCTTLLGLASQTKPELFDLKGKKVMMLAPIYRGLNGRTFFTMWRCMAQYGPEKIGLIPRFQTVIHEARNMLVQDFLSTDSEWAIMFDDDMVPPCGSSQITNRYFRAGLPEPLASFNAISRIMSHPSDKLVIGATYVVKSTPSIIGHKNAGRVVCDAAFKDDQKNKEFHNPTQGSGLIKCESWVGLGFSRLHRSVFETIIKAIPGRWPELMPTSQGGHFGVFQPIGPDVNEDTSFCRRCRAVGIDCWLDTGLIVGHCDGTSTWWTSNTK